MHFENFTGISGRLEQFTEVLQHCNTASGCPPGAPAIIGGDFNTLVKTVMRVSLTHLDARRFAIFTWPLSYH